MKTERISSAPATISVKAAIIEKTQELSRNGPITGASRIRGSSIGAR